MTGEPAPPARAPSGDGAPGGGRAPGRRRAPEWGLALLLVAAAAVSWLPLAAIVGRIGCRPSWHDLLVAMAGCALAGGVMAAVLAARSGRSATRSSLHGLLIAAAVLLVLAVPLGRMRDVDRGRQERTMEAMRNVAAAIEALATRDGYPAGLTVPQLAERLEFRKPAILDAWGHPLQVRVERDRYVLRSAGLCGELETAEAAELQPGGRACYEDDIVFDTGRFTVYPDGPQRSCD